MKRILTRRQGTSFHPFSKNKFNFFDFQKGLDLHKEGLTCS